AKQKYIYLNYGIALTFYLICIFTPSIVNGLWHYSTGYFPKAGFLEPVFVVWFYSLMTLSFLNFFKLQRQEQNIIRRKNLRLVFVAFAVGFFGSVEYLPNYGIPFFPAAFLPMFLFASIMGYCVVRYKMMDIETVIHKTAMWLVSSIVTVFPFALIVYVLQPFFGRLNPIAMTLCVTAASFLFYLYYEQIQPRLSRVFQQADQNLQRTFIKFNEELVMLKNLRDLVQRSVRLLRRNLYVRAISIYLRDDEKNQLVPVIIKGLRGLKPLTLNDPFINWLERSNEVALEEFAAGHPEIEEFKANFSDYFSACQAFIAVPLVANQKIIGIINLGKKENLRRYSVGEIKFLTQLKFPLTIALSNSMQFENVSKLYKQVQYQNDRLKELDRLKSQFLANTSHELRTPLNGILGLVEAVLDGADGEVNSAQSRHLRMILESGANLKELINNLLELSKLESGQTHLNIKPFNILNAVTVVLALLEGIAGKKGVQLKCESEKDLPDVYGDPEKIQRVLLNLAGNALKFTEKGSVVIRLQKHEGRIRISIEDTGIGIKEQDLKVIFERFRQADGGETRNYEGTGLGLSIARDIVLLHHSDISVTSRFGQGSTFAFEMPTASFEQAPITVQEDAPLLVKEDTPQLSQPQEPEATEEKVYELSHDPDGEAIVRGNGELVLVVDDNAVNREVIRARLGMNNYRVVEAIDGQEALEKVSSDKPAIVLLDLMMPRMSGYEFCKQVRKEHSADELPIIMLTAKTDMGDKVFGLNIGANDYLSKPFHQEELLARVGVLLRLRAMHAELRGWNTQLEARVEERTRDLHATQKQLIQAEKMATVGTFAGGIAHEINNPLTAVLTNAQVLKMTSVNEEDKELVDLIEEGAKRCQIIIQKLMKYSRKADLDSARQAVSLEKVVQSVCGLLSYQLLQDNVTIEQDLAGLPSIQGNAGELEQVFTNMILNAKDAILSTERGEGLIRIQGRKTENEIRIEVIDNGTGIKKENLTKIFDPFFTTKDVGSGTGLGLSVTHGILERHGCRVFVESEWGVGTTFVLVFPLGN
ncbi:MAG: response regulator, partial [Candidatus Omnitrophica bacterium]|nr:response regulator [Candidatus Omnitrophota bacterium]